MENKVSNSDIPMYKKFRVCYKGMINGAIVGYVFSFFQQNDFVQMKLGFGGYLTHFFHVIFSFNSIGFTAWIGMAIGSFAGQFIQMKLAEAGKIAEPKGWAKLREEAEKEN